MRLLNDSRDTAKRRQWWVMYWLKLRTFYPENKWFHQHPSEWFVIYSVQVVREWSEVCAIMCIEQFMVATNKGHHAWRNHSSYLLVTMDTLLKHIYIYMIVLDCVCIHVDGDAAALFTPKLSILFRCISPRLPRRKKYFGMISLTSLILSKKLDNLQQKKPFSLSYTLACHIVKNNNC